MSSLKFSPSRFDGTLIKWLLGLLVTAAFFHVSCAAETDTDRDTTSTLQEDSRFVLQIGQFDDETAAQDWADKLKAAGVPAYLEQRVQPDGLVRALLRAGPFPDRASASAALFKVRQAGLGVGTRSTDDQKNGQFTSPAGSRFVLQIGQFDDETAAQNWVNALKAAGVPAYLTHRVQPNGLRRALLRAGPFPDRASASAALVKVRQAGLGGGARSADSQFGESDSRVDTQSDGKSPLYKLRFAGDIYRYPKGESEGALLAAVSELQCMNSEGVRLCTAKASLFQQVLFAGLPGTCLLGKDIVLVLKHAHLESLSCDVAPSVASDIYDINREKFGDPITETKQVYSMKVTSARWKIGEDDFDLVAHTGTDLYGNPISNTRVTISASSR
ncbi:hypothetical protein CBA19CS11_32155 [Caballeronia novacaledonica]|uniref:SPOR domain-containing protein n=1 Tax=Caballeronia novacaledonica TaxID=1544861 RepID=UPI00207E6D1B|nr:hypothetical protein CBA19CS11_32155 [Caballeronia novacaledonica]